MNDITIGLGCVLGAMFGVLIGLYLALSFIVWIGDVIENKSWKYWWSKR